MISSKVRQTGPDRIDVTNEKSQLRFSGGPRVHARDLVGDLCDQDNDPRAAAVTRFFELREDARSSGRWDERLGGEYLNDMLELKAFLLQADDVVKLRRHVRVLAESHGVETYGLLVTNGMMVPGRDALARSSLRHVNAASLVSGVFAE